MYLTLKLYVNVIRDIIVTQNFQIKEWTTICSDVGEKNKIGLNEWTKERIHKKWCCAMDDSHVKIKIIDSTF